MTRRRLAILVCIGLVAASCGGGNSAPRTRDIRLDTEVITYAPVSPSVLEVIFDVTNPRNEAVFDVPCFVDAYVSTTRVSTFLSGGEVSGILENDTRRVRTSAEINDGQAAFVTRVEVQCRAEITLD